MKLIGNITGSIICVFLFLLHAIILEGQVQEVCDNAMDDDGDGFIDLNDSDCICTMITPVSRIPNPSFEEISCCPHSIAELSCAVGWIQASLTTTDLIHDCGWNGFRQFPPPRPFPDGQGIIGFRDGRKFDNSNDVQTTWKEYAGACLTAPLNAGATYRLELYLGFVSAIASPVFDLTIFGTTSCEYLPFDISDEAFGCPTNEPHWRQLTSTQVGKNRGWWKVELEFTTEEDINAIAIGPSCEGTKSSLGTYYFLDKLVLDDTRNFDWVIIEDGHPCERNFGIHVTDRPGFSYQWYKDGIALPGKTGPGIDRLSEGTYQLRFTGDEGCFVTGPYSFKVPVIEEETAITICSGGSFDFGDEVLREPGEYVHTFSSVHGCDSTVFLTLDVLPPDADTMEIKIFPDESFKIGNQRITDKGTHDIKMVDGDGCESYIHLDLQHYAVFWPTVFSPNGDGSNDIFAVYAGPELLLVKELNVYNRWGGKIWTGKNIMPNEENGWDGRAGTEIPEQGVYVFHAVLVMDSGLEKDVFGSVLLLK